MQYGFLKNGIVDSRLMLDWDMSSATDLAKASPVYDMQEQGGFSEKAQFQMEVRGTLPEGGAATLTISSCDTPDGTFVATQTLTSTLRSDGEDMSWERISCHCKRFVKVTASVVDDEAAAATGTGVLRFQIAC